MKNPLKQDPREQAQAERLRKMPTSYTITRAQAIEMVNRLDAYEFLEPLFPGLFEALHGEPIEMDGKPRPYPAFHTRRKRRA